MTAPPARSRRRLWPIILAVIVLPFVLFSLYVGLMLTWNYSDGDRAGVAAEVLAQGMAL